MQLFRRTKGGKGAKRGRKGAQSTSAGAAKGAATQSRTSVAPEDCAAEDECPVCLSLVCVPIVMPCGHVVCETCLRQLLHHGVRSWRRKQADAQANAGWEYPGMAAARAAMAGANQLGCPVCRRSMTLDKVEQLSECLMLSRQLTKSYPDEMARRVEEVKGLASAAEYVKGERLVKAASGELNAGQSGHHQHFHMPRIGVGIDRISHSNTWNVDWKCVGLVAAAVVAAAMLAVACAWAFAGVAARDGDGDVAVGNDISSSSTLDPSADVVDSTLGGLDVKDLADTIAPFAVDSLFGHGTFSLFDAVFNAAKDDVCPIEAEV